MSLPARVRLSRPPLPLAVPLRAAIERLCPQVKLDELSGVALAIAGGKVIGVRGQWAGLSCTQLESGWRGRGIEEALAELLPDPPT